VSVTDAYGCIASQGYTIAIGCASITLAPLTPPSGTTGIPYSQTFTPGGGIPPYTISVASGSITNGLTLLSSGVLSGTPTASGTFTFTVMAIDGAGCTGSQSYALAVNCPSITLNPATLPNGTSSLAYSQTATATGGTGPYTFALTAGSLPPGMVLTSAGTIMGTPAIAGPYNFTVTATDANRCTGNRVYSLTIGCPALAIAPLTVPGGSIGIPYSQTLTGSGGAAPYSLTFQAERSRRVLRFPQEAC